MKAITISQYEEIIAKFMIAARHARNYPHPEITIERVRAAATLAETNLEYVLGKEGFERINKLAFPDAKISTKRKIK